MPTRTFTVAQLEELDVNPYSSKVLANIEGYNGRWSTRRHLVFEHEGRYWEVDYDEPATEMQGGQDRWPNGDSPEAEVVAREVVPMYEVTRQFRSADALSEAVDPAAEWIIDNLADDLHDLNDGYAPFGLFAKSMTIGRAALIVSPDTNPEHWDDWPGDEVPHPEHTNLTPGQAPELPVVVVAAKRIR